MICKNANLAPHYISDFSNNPHGSDASITPKGS
jgi:hypothetical protein